MPYCSILECKNDSRRRNYKNGGVSYHRFPKNPSVKEKWIDATGRNNWMPTKFSTICSEHFLEEEFLTSNKGNRFLKSTSIPCIKIVKFLDQVQNFKSQPKKSLLQEGFVDTQKVEQNCIPKEGDIIPGQFHFEDVSVQIKKEPIENTDATGCSNCSTQNIKKLKGQLRFFKDKIVKQFQKIKRLQSKNLRLRKIINNIAGQEKLGLPKNANLEVSRINRLRSRKHVKQESFQEESIQHCAALH